jgi:hypothetical protein
MMDLTGSQRLRIAKLAPATDPLAPSASQCPVASSPSVGQRPHPALPSRQLRPERIKMLGSFDARFVPEVAFIGYRLRSFHFPLHE